MNTKKLLSLFIICLYGAFAIAQEPVIDELKLLNDAEQYDKIIDQYAGKTKDYSAKELYYIGLAYYMKENDENCLKFMNASIKKDASDPAAHFTKGSTLYYMKKYEESIKSFQEAIALENTNATSYSGLGDSYYKLNKLKEALDAYTLACQQSNVGCRPYAMKALIHSDLNDKETSLKAYYTVKEKCEKGSDSYLNALFNIGLFEYEKENMEAAERSFLEHIELAPDDFHSYAKMAQVYYFQKEYKKAVPYKEKLYAAYKAGKLSGNLKNMFCFDQFKWKNKSIQVFERFAEDPSDIYVKHIFYVIDEKGEIEFKIQTEYSPISVELGGAKYLICKSMGDSHATYNYGFNDDFNYDDLKKTVIKILNEEVKPTASSRPGN